MMSEITDQELCKLSHRNTRKYKSHIIFMVTWNPEKKIVCEGYFLKKMKEKWDCLLRDFFCH